MASLAPASLGSSWMRAGTLLEGTYRVLDVLGKGAMGTVFLVEHVALGKRFAAKVVTDVARMDSAAVQRLRNEARMAGAIDHDNIVGVSHLGVTDEGYVFVVMELLRGEDLRAFSARRQLRAKQGEGHAWLEDDEVRAIITPILGALEAAHEVGVVHRDLKPENIFLHERAGKIVPKIVDFGIGKLRSPDASDLRLTATGQIVGTPLYMAPEQTRSTTEVDHRADLYAMGVMLFELLTGRLPFEASHIYEIVLKHVTEPPPDPRTLRPELSEALATLVLRCLEKEPAARFASAKELAQAWDDAWRGRGEVPLLRAEHPRSSELSSMPPAGSASLAETLAAESGDSHPSSRSGVVAASRGSTPTGSGASSPRSSGPSASASRSSSPGASGSEGRAPGASGAGAEARSPTTPAAAAPSARDAHPSTAIDTSTAAPRGSRGSRGVLGLGLGLGLAILLVALAWLRSSPAAPTDEATSVSAPRASAASAREASPTQPAADEPREAETAPSSPPGAASPSEEPTSAPSEPVIARRRIESEPSGAEVLREGEVLGTTPLEVELEAGTSLRIELRRRGFQPLVETLSEASPPVVRLRLSRRSSTPGNFPSLAPR